MQEKENKDIGMWVSIMCFGNIRWPTTVRLKDWTKRGRTETEGRTKSCCRKNFEV